MPTISERDARMAELKEKWEPKGAPEDIARYGVDIDAAKAEHEALDWDSLIEQFPKHAGVKGATYRRPTFAEFVEISKAGAAQLHADAYLARKSDQIVEVATMNPAQYKDFIGDRPVTKGDLLDAMGTKLGFEREAVFNITIEIGARGLPSMEKRGLTGEGKVPVPARVFTGLNTARAIFEGSEFQLEGKYLLPMKGDRQGQVLLPPVERLLTPRQPQPANA